jgi:WD40 repeat protein
MIELSDVNTQKRLVGTRAPGTSFIIGFSPDGQKLITTGSAGIYLWDANSLELLGSLIKPLSEGSEAFFLPDGRVLACYKQSDRIGIWTLESP